MTAALTAAPMAAGTQVHEYKRTIALYEGSRTPGMDLFDFTTEIAHGVVVPTCTGPFSWQNTMMINATLILLSTKVNYALAAVKSLGKEATAKHVLPTIEPRQIRDNLQRATYSSPEEYEKICWVYGGNVGEAYDSVDFSFDTKFFISQLPEPLRKLLQKSDGQADLAKFQIQEHLLEYPWLGSFPNLEQALSASGIAARQQERGYQRFWLAGFVKATSANEGAFSELSEALEWVVSSEDVGQRTNILQILAAQTRPLARAELQLKVQASLEYLAGTKVWTIYTFIGAQYPAVSKAFKLCCKATRAMLLFAASSRTATVKLLR